MKNETPNFDLLKKRTHKLIDISEAKPGLKTNKKRTGPVRVKEAEGALELAVSKAVTARTTNGGHMKQQATDDAFKNFEQAIGGRVELGEILKHCPPEVPAFKALKRLLEDVDFNATRDVTLAFLCGKHKINLAQVLVAFRDSLAIKMNVETVQRLSKHLSPVVEDLADDSKNRFERCTVCMGKARVPRIGENGEFALDEDGTPITQLCYNCRGTGKVFTKHDPQSRKLFFTLAGLLKPEGRGNDQPTVQIANITGNFTPGDGSYEYLIKAIDKVAIPARVGGEEILDVIPNTVYEAEESQNPITSA